MEQMIFSQAWDVPNSNMVVNLKKMKMNIWDASNKPKFYYSVGVSLKNGGSVGYSMFNERGDDPYGAFENLMAKIEKASSLTLKILDKCDATKPDNVPVVSYTGWRITPRLDSDFTLGFFSSLSRMVYLMDNADDFSIFIQKCNSERHVVQYAYIDINGEVVYMAKPAGDKKEMINNLKLSACGALAMLEKFQNMAWNVMIDNSDPEYDVTSHGHSFSGCFLSKIDKE